MSTPALSAPEHPSIGRPSPIDNVNVSGAAPVCLGLLGLAAQFTRRETGRLSCCHSFGGTVDYFVDTVFNYPTLAECDKSAAFNGINRLAV